MSYRRSVHETPDLPHRPEAVLPDGRRIERGDEFSIPHEGRFRFHYLFEPDGSLTAFGPVNSKSAQWRAFRPEAVKTIHRSKTHHAERKAS